VAALEEMLEGEEIPVSTGSLLSDIPNFYQSNGRRYMLLNIIKRIKTLKNSSLPENQANGPFSEQQN